MPHRTAVRTYSGDQYLGLHGRVGPGLALMGAWDRDGIHLAPVAATGAGAGREVPAEASCQLSGPEDPLEQPVVLPAPGDAQVLGREAELDEAAFREHGLRRDVVDERAGLDAVQLQPVRSEA